MKNTHIGIIGGTGGIGKWFASFFREEGLPVHIVGRKQGMSFPDLAACCPVVIVAVPIAATLDVIRKVAPHLPEDALLMDMTSLKEEPVQAMLAASRSEVIGCHPLFGPDVPSLEGQNIVLCPARGGRWFGFLQQLFFRNGARITVTSPAQHDRMMALIQGLTHLSTILMELTLRDSGAEPSELSAFSTPVFRTKQAIIEKVFGPNQALYEGILTENSHIAEIIDLYEKNLQLLKERILNRDAIELSSLMKKAPPDH